MKTPKTNTAEILYTLITKGEVSIMDYSYMSGFRTRISEIKLDHHLDLIRDLKTKVNGHGNSYSYAVHRLNPFHKRNAINIYNIING